MLNVSKVEGMLNTDRYSHDISTNNFKFSYEPICTAGITHCIGLIAIAQDGALIGHFSDVSERKHSGERAPGWDSFIEALLVAAANGAEQYMLAGGAPMMKNSVDTVARDRFYMQAYLIAHHGSKVMMPVWSEAGQAIDIGYNPLNEESTIIIAQHPRVEFVGSEAT